MTLIDSYCTSLKLSQHTAQNVVKNSDKHISSLDYTARRWCNQNLTVINTPSI